MIYDEDGGAVGRADSRIPG